MANGREANAPVNAESPDDDVLDRAKELYARDGEIEFDNDAEVSRGAENGVYVQAWVWVPFGED